MRHLARLLRAHALLQVEHLPARRRQVTLEAGIGPELSVSLDDDVMKRCSSILLPLI